MRRIMQLLVLSLLVNSLLANEEILIKVDGMHCPLCTTAVKKALKNVDGVIKAKAILGTKTATVVAQDGIEDTIFLKAVQSTGYEGVIISRKKVE